MKYSCSIAFFLWILFFMILYPADLFSQNKPYWALDASDSREKGSEKLFQVQVDPYENAFEVKMPEKGWCSIVGMTRKYGIAVSLGRAVSLDRSSQLFFGDAHIPVYIPLDSDGPEIPENHPVFVKKDVMAPEVFARQYLVAKWKEKGELTILNILPDKELDEIMRNKASDYPNSNFKIDAVKAVFILKTGQAEIKGELNCAIVQSEKQFWTAELSGFTTSGDPETIHDILLTVLRSYKTNSDWITRQAAAGQQTEPYRSISPDRFLMGYSHDGWRYYWKNIKTGQIRPTEIFENPDPDRYERWIKGELCKHVYWE